MFHRALVHGFRRTAVTLLTPSFAPLDSSSSPQDTPTSELPLSESTQPEPTPSASDDGWAEIFARLRARFPGASDGVLFCIHKLQQNPDLKLRDFKDEAALHRVPLSGRSYHSARVALGLEKPVERKRTAPAPVVVEAPPANVGRPAQAARVPDAAESPAIAALLRFQEEHAAEMQRLRDGIKRALAVIDEVLADE